MLFTIDLHENFIDEKCVAVSLVLSLQASGVFGSKLDTPESNGFVGDRDATFSQEIFNIAMAEVESIIQPDCVTDEVGGPPRCGNR